VPRRNRVTPSGDLVAVPERGAFTGNRGCLHSADGVIIRDHVGTRWITCLLEFKGRRRTLMQPGRWTELFFLDEATALAAGHRPCAACRRPDFVRFRQAWSEATGGPAGVLVDEIDRVLHRERVAGRDTKVTHRRPWPSLPDGAMAVDRDGNGAVVVVGDAVRRWSPGGYGPPMARPASGDAVVLTPASTVDAIVAGYRPTIHQLDA
jgi:hypothetical protein